MFITRGEGSWLWDNTGNKYLDMASGRGRWRTQGLEAGGAEGAQLLCGNSMPRLSTYVQCLLLAPKAAVPLDM
jgi:hypothetical protein